MKNRMNRKTNGQTGAGNSNRNETVAGGLRLRTAVRAGVSEIVVTKTTDC